MNIKKLFFLLIAVSILSCKTEKNINYSLISGVISNSTSTKIVVRNQFDSSLKKEILIDENGVFHDTIQLKNPAFYTFNQDKNTTQLFLSKGDAIKIKYDAKNLDTTFQVSGTGSMVINYLKEKDKLTKTAIKNTKTLYALEEKEFTEKLDNLKTKQEDLLYKIDGLALNFKENETKNIHYQYLSYLSNFETYHGYFGENKEFKVSDNLTNKLSNLNLENEKDFEFSSNYRRLITTNLRKITTDVIEKDSTVNYDIAFIQAVSEIKNQNIKNKLAYDEAKYGITFAEDVDTYYNDFLKMSTNEENNQKVKESYIKIKALAKGSPSPTFTQYENNAGGKTSLSDLKEKYVYIDVWATWCGPCIGEIPALKKIEKKYHDKNIEFVSISIDDKKDHEKWLKMIADKELGGIQLFADKDWKSQFIEDYMIKGIPRFILIDPKGNIINANAPRPSDKKLVALLEELNI